MRFWDSSSNKNGNDNDESDSSESIGVINYGRQKKDGSHDHRTNKGEDRTPSQKNGDTARRKH